MGHFNVHGSFATHPKVRALKGDSRALSCWTLMGSACSREGTNGHVTPKMLDDVLHHMTSTSRRAAALALVRVKLWKVTPDGWEFHDWSEYQDDQR